MSQSSVNRIIRRHYRKRLLPHVEQCLLGRALPRFRHHERQMLDRQAAAELLACFEGQTWLCDYDYSVETMFSIWRAWVNDMLVRGRGQEVSIGNFARYLYDEQVAHDQNKLESILEPSPSATELHSRRLALLATLYICGYVPSFEPESLAELC